MNEARVLPARIWLRRSDRVRIIFSVPPASSRGDDVARDERGDELGAEARGEGQHDERERDPVWRRLCPSGTSYGPPFWKAITVTNRTGRSAAAPMPM